MVPPHDNGQHQPGPPQSGAVGQGDDATRYGAAPPADAEGTRYGAGPPPAAGGDSTRYPETPTDPDRTGYGAPAPPGDPGLTRYVPGPADPHATGYKPSDSKADAGSARGLPYRFGGYELLEEVGHGGMGVVYRARQADPDRLVALKMLRAGELATAADVRHFHAEANEAARLDHPHIVPVYEVGEQSGRHFFTMKLVEGGSLDRHLDRYANDRPAAARLVATVARAVHHAHQRQLLHRDLKPSNILLDAQGQPHVADFGLAKRLGGSGDVSQSAGVGVGTPEYMAPEQARGERLTTAADVYGLGGILYALLTGRPPFKGTSAWETMEQVLSRAPLPPSKCRPGCPRDLETVCLKCLDKDPARRYGSAEALADDLGRWLMGEPVVARPLGRMQRFWRRCRRNPALAATLTALVVTVLGSLVALTALYVRAEGQRQMAEHREAEAWTVRRFYEDHVLSAARPMGWEGGIGKDVSLRQALDQAGPTIDAAFAGQPELEGAVRNTLGMTYYYLAQYEAAGPHLEKAYRVRLEQVGPDHPDTLSSLHNLAMLRWKQGKVKQAIALGRQALERRRLVLGLEHEDTLFTQLNLGLFLEENDQFDEAEVVLRQAIDLCKHALGPEHRYTLYGQNDLAIVLWDKGNQEESIALDRQTMAGRRRSLGPDHPDTLRSMGNLASSLNAVGQLKEAEVLQRQTLEARRRVLGLDHEETLWSQNFLVTVLRREGKVDEAEKLSRQAMETGRRALGPENKTTLSSQEDLALVLRDQGKLEEAEKLHRDILEITQRLLGAGTSQTLNSQYFLAIVLREQEKLDEAEELLHQALETGRQVYGPENPDTMFTQDQLVQVLEAQGKLDEAEKLCRRTLDVRCRVLGTGNPNTLVSQYRLASLFEGQSRLDEAEKLYRQTLDQERRVLDPQDPSMLLTEAALARVLGERGKLNEAEKVFRETLGTQRKVLGADHIDVAGTLTDFGYMLMKNGQAAEAETLLRECLAIRRKRLPAGNWRIANAQSLLGGCLARQQKYAEAEPLLLAGGAGVTLANGAPFKRVAGALDRIIELYEQWGKPDQAEAWRKKRPPSAPRTST